MLSRLRLAFVILHPNHSPAPTQTPLTRPNAAAVLLHLPAGAIFQMVQWPGPEACQSNTWLYDCAQWMNLQAMNNNLQGQATDQASAMAQMAAMQAAEQAQMAAMQAAQEQMAAGGSQQAGGAGQAAMPGQSVAGVPGMDQSAAAGVPGLGGAGGAGMGIAGGAGMGGAGGMAGAGMGGAGMGGAGMGMGGAGMQQQPSSSLMGNNMLGHRHLLQAGMMGAGAMSTAGPTAMPTTSLSAACQKPIQGLVTAAGGGVMVVPNFKGVATMMTRGNDTMFIQLGGQGSNCVAAYKLKSGQIMDMGRPKDAPAAATAKSAAVAAVVSSAASIMLVLATLLLAL